MRLYGVDFTSAPRRAKPITVACGYWREPAAGTPLLAIEAVRTLDSLDAFDHWLRQPGPWLGAFDFPFGLPRDLLDAFGWLAKADRVDSTWAHSIRQAASLSRSQLIERLRTFCAGRPVGHKFAHRAADGPAGSSPSMKWVNPPVALMLHAGAPRLLQAGLSLPGLHAGDPDRIALEAYPGFLARSIVGRDSYKSDDRARQTPERLVVRERIVAGIDQVATGWGFSIRPAPGLIRECLEDASGDRLDAVLCLAQAAWAWQRREQGWGLPSDIDPVEGWIVSVPPGAAPE
jgi:hypothetical protein